MTESNTSLATIGQKAPEWSVSDWAQGGPVALAELYGQVVLIEVFQVNCPGCFLYSLPKAIELHQRYKNRGLTIIAIATAFEDFEKNTLENLQALINTGTVIGETQRLLSAYGHLKNGHWPYVLPFAVAMDRLIENPERVTPEAVMAFITQKLPDFHRHTASEQRQIQARVSQYLRGLRYRAETFERYQLQGTPSQLLIDRQGILRFSRFGEYPELERDIERLLAEH